jgi:hypothetical protein
MYWESAEEAGGAPMQARSEPSEWQLFISSAHCSRYTDTPLTCLYVKMIKHRFYDLEPKNLKLPM